MRAGPAIAVRWGYSGAVALTVVLGLGSPPTAVGFQAPQTAEQWNARGVQLRKKQQPEQALEAFQRAHDLAPSAKSRGQLGFVQHDLGRYVVAEKYLVEALSDQRDPWVVKNRRYLSEALDQSRAHIGYLLITGPAGAQVHIQGALTGSLPLPEALALEQGQASVSVSAPGYLPSERVIVVRPRVTETYKVDLIPDRRDLPGDGHEIVRQATGQESNSVVQPAPVISGGWGARRVGGVAALAASAIALSAGIASLAIDGNPSCANPPPGSQCNRLHDTRTLGWGLIGGAAVAAVGGVILYRSSRGVSLSLSPGSLAATGRF